MNNPLLDQENNRLIASMAEEKLCPMPVAIERERFPHWPVVTHRPENCQADQIVEAISGIKEGCATWLIILIQETCVFQ